MSGSSRAIALWLYAKGRSLLFTEVVMEELNQEVEALKQRFERFDQELSFFKQALDRHEADILRLKQSIQGLILSPKRSSLR